MNLKTDVLVFNNFYLFWILSFFFFIILGYFKLQKNVCALWDREFFFPVIISSLSSREMPFLSFFLCPVIILIVIVYNSFSCLFTQIQLLDRKVGFHIIFIFISDHLSINGIHTWLYTFFLNRHKAT